MQLDDLRRNFAGYHLRTHAEKITILGWYLHTHKGMHTFGSPDLRKCYDQLHDTAPSSFSGYLDNLLRNKQILKSGKSFRLSGDAREAVAKKINSPGYKVEISSLLKGLPAQIPDLAERTYLDEALVCYEHNAFRAAVVMTWNLAYHHLCSVILAKHLAAFNSRWLLKFPNQHKNGTKQITSIESFAEYLKEGEVISIARDASIISKDVHRIMEEKLGKRNSAAHASGVVVGQLQTDAFIDDLVRNVVVTLV